MKSHLIFVLIFYFLPCHGEASLGHGDGSDQFDEELVMKALSSGHVNTYFQFTIRYLLQNNRSLLHTHLVPRPLAEIFHKFDLKELHLSLTSGLWRYENWGYPVVDAAPGAELLGWFDSSRRTVKEIDGQWKELCGLLSGLFCASLNFIDHTNTVRPKYTFRPTFSTARKEPLNDSNYQIRYGTLPHEIVCTENLTPWKNLLPIHPNEGLMSLVKNYYIHSTNYHSLGLHVRRLASAEAELLEIRQTLNLVFDEKFVTRSNLWSLRKMFGQGLNGSSEMATSSTVYVDITNQSFKVTPEPTRVITSHRGGSTTQFAVFDVKGEFKRLMFNIGAIYETDDTTVAPFQKPPLFANRYLFGHGRERGKIVTRITNTHWTPLNVILQENLPWFVPVYLHTLRITISGSGEVIKPNAIHYIPGRLRERASHLEVAFKCPSLMTVEVSIDFDYVLLRLRDYPPDESHGFYIGSAVVMAQLPIARNFTAIPIDGHLFADSFNASRPAGYLVNIRTESLLITLPTPDFTMMMDTILTTLIVIAIATQPIITFCQTKATLRKEKIECGVMSSHISPIETIRMYLPFGKSNKFVFFDFFY